jgi:hypothetical protein
MDAPQVVLPEGAAEAPVSRKTRGPALVRWQERLLPVMAGMLVALAAFFFVVTLAQMTTLQRSIAQVPRVVLPPAVVPEALLEGPGVSHDAAARHLELAAAMEAYLVERRYHQASVMLMSGVWTRYLGFVTGMVLALVGASFILGKLEGTPTALEGKGAGIEGSLRTASPGLILVVLGAALMLATIADRDLYETRDSAIYLPTWGTAATAQGASTPAPTAMPLRTSTPPAR